MPLIADYCLDRLLAAVSEANKLTLCTQEPVTYAGATATYKVGHKDAPAIGAPADRAPNGRKVAVAAIAGGVITGPGTATHWALVDTVNARLLAANALFAGQVVTSGNAFTCEAFDVGVPDAA